MFRREKENGVDEIGQQIVSSWRRERKREREREREREKTKDQLLVQSQSLVTSTCSLFFPIML